MTRGSAQGARLLVARATLLEGTATLRGGDRERALALYEEARATFEQAGDKGGLARALTATGNRPRSITGTPPAPSRCTPRR